MEKHSSEEHPMRENYGMELPDASEGGVADEHPAVREKSLELKQAQVASFAAERLSHPEDAHYVFDHIGAIASGEASDVKRVTERPETVIDETGNYHDVGQGEERSVATAQEYADYLREVGGSRHEAIANRAELLQGYRAFEPLVKSLREDLERYPLRFEHPNFLGAGDNADAFSLHTEEGEYVVRVPKGEAINASAVDHHLGGGVRAKGLPHLEQIVAVSYESGVTISERMPGQVMTKIKPGELEHITEQQLNDLIDTIFIAGRAGVNIDHNPNNLLYDPEQGFGVIDLSANNETTAQEAVYVASNFAMSLSSAGGYIEANTLDNLRLYAYR